MYSSLFKLGIEREQSFAMAFLLFLESAMNKQQSIKFLIAQLASFLTTIDQLHIVMPQIRIHNARECQ